MINKWLKIVDNFFDPKIPQTIPAQEEQAAASAMQQPVLEESKKIGSAEAGGAQGSSQNFSRKKSARSNMLSGIKQAAEKRIAVHCVAGLGRAPFLVALAIVYKGCAPQNAIKLIRSQRKGALNPIQANYILEMKAGKGIPRNSNKTQGCGCNIFWRSNNYFYTPKQTPELRIDRQK